MTDRYQSLFAATAGRSAFIPFLMLGDPGPAVSAQLLDAVLAAGADAVEVGFPFSDPVADGPVVQAAARRALAAGVTTARCWDLVAGLRARAPDLPIGVLVYANLVVRPGLKAFYQAAARAGADSVLVADVPAAESEPFRAEADRAGVAAVLIAPPNASAERLARIAAAGRGYTYVTSRRGVTGEGGADGALATTIARLAAVGAPPAVVGFGIATPAHLAAAARSGAAGVIAGSALIGVVETARAAGRDPAAAAAGFVAAMREAADGIASAPAPTDN